MGLMKIALFVLMKTYLFGLMKINLYGLMTTTLSGNVEYSVILTHEETFSGLLKTVGLIKRNLPVRRKKPSSVLMTIALSHEFN